MAGVCLYFLHYPVGRHLMYQTVKSRIELDKRLHYTPLVPLTVLLLVRSTLSYMQIQFLFS